MDKDDLVVRMLEIQHHAQGVCTIKFTAEEVDDMRAALEYVLTSTRPARYTVERIKEAVYAEVSDGKLIDCICECLTLKQKMLEERVKFHEDADGALGFELRRDGKFIKYIPMFRAEMILSDALRAEKVRGAE